MGSMSLRLNSGEDVQFILSSPLDYEELEETKGAQSLNPLGIPSSIDIPSHDDLLCRARDLNAELELFATHVEKVVGSSYSSKGNHVADTTVRTWRTMFGQELRCLEKMKNKIMDSHASTNYEDTIKIAQVVKCCNIPFFEALWAVAKQSRNIVLFGKKMISRLPQKRGKGKNGAVETRYRRGQPPRVLAPGTHLVPVPLDSEPQQTKDSLVDIICEDGLVWVKVSSITPSRFCWDMTKLGWAAGVDEESPDEEEEDNFEQFPLYEMAKRLVEAAECHTIRNQRPQTHLVLLRLPRGVFPGVDKLLGQIEKLGVKVISTAKDTSTSNPDENSFNTTLKSSPPLTSETLDWMMPSNPFAYFSSHELNIDTSILIALVSDFSHSTSLTPQPWFRTTEHAHLNTEHEPHGGILRRWLYPALGAGAQDLVCCRAAWETCHTIVATMGSESEKARAELLFTFDDDGEEGDTNVDDPTAKTKTAADLRARFAAMSHHAIPSGVKLPIRVLAKDSPDQELTAANKKLPRRAAKALTGKAISGPTRHVFALGWATCRTTLTTNGGAVQALTRNLEFLGDDGAGDEEDLRAGEVDWPSMWLCPCARSLLGVPRESAGVGDVVLPDG